MIRKCSGARVAAAFSLILVMSMATVGLATNASPAVPVANVTIASSGGAYDPLQTLTYRSTVTARGTLAQITMGIPRTARTGSLRSSSGTVRLAVAQPHFIVWRPARPIAVTAGMRLAISVAGVYFGGRGTYRLGLRAVTAAGGVLSAGYGSLVLASKPTACRASWPSSYIKTENAKAGTAGWQIPAAAYKPAALSAYASRQSAGCGNIVYLKVDARSSNGLRLAVYRVGYYHGVGARKVWVTSSGKFLGGRQSPARILNGTNRVKPDNMVSVAHWWYNIGIRVDGSYTPGTYLIRIDDLAGHQTFVPLTVLDSTKSRHAYRLQQATTTWQAYNPYGGRSFYSKIGSARLSFDRPYLDGQGSGQFLSLEYGMVYFMEKQGLDVDYWTDMDLHNHAASLRGRIRTLVLPAHDEYYSLAMRNGLKSAIASRINLVSFGANQAYRQIRPDRSQRAFVVFERWTAWPKSTTWRYRGPSLHEQGIFGAEYGCRSNGTVTTNRSWMWARVASGTKLSGFANGETDYVHPARQAPIPTGTKVLTTARLDSCGASGAALRMDIVARTDRSGARVFGGSTFAYGCFAVGNCPTNWRVGGFKGKPLVVTAKQAQVVGQMVLNVLSWANTGVKAAGLAPQQGLTKSSANEFQALVTGPTSPSGGLPRLVLGGDGKD